MPDQLKPIIENLIECFDGKPWYGISVMEKLEDIPWEIVNQKRNGDKSIAVLVQHIINWRIFVLMKLRGHSEYDMVLDGAMDWVEVHIADQQEWKGLQQRLVETQQEILAVLNAADDTILAKQVPGKGYTFTTILIGITQHDSYHLGQIAMLNADTGR